MKRFLQFQHATQTPFLLTLFLCTLTTFSISGCSKNDNADIKQERLRPVKFQLVEAPKSTRTHIYSGTLKSVSEVNRSFKVNGTIENVSVKIGDSLEKGDVIANIDEKQYELQVEKSRASLTQAQADSRNMNSKYQRTKGLYENNNTSRDNLESTRAAFESARAQVRSANKSLELALLDLGYTVLRASQSCLVAEVLVEANENVVSGAPVVALNCGEVSEVDVAVPESIISHIIKGMIASVHFDAMPGKNFDATVSEVGVTSGGGAAFPVTLTLNQIDEHLRSGSSADVTFSIASSEGGESRLFLPPVAVGEDINGRFVFTLEPAESEQVAVVRRRAVEVGELTSLGLEILSGIEVGNRVVTAGTSVIRDGLRVKTE